MIKFMLTIAAMVFLLLAITGGSLVEERKADKRLSRAYWYAAWGCGLIALFFAYVAGVA